MDLPKALKVKVGSRPSHIEHNALAQAFNARILSGLGDCAWRIFYYAYSTFRGVRNPNGTMYPQEDEWFKFYGSLETKMSYGKFSWPEMPAGSPEGANVANPFMAWIFGNAARVRSPDGSLDNSKDGIHGFWSESARLGGLEKMKPDFQTQPYSPEHAYGHENLSLAWHDAENQRGCVAYVNNYKKVIYIPQKPPGGATVEKQLLSFGVVGAARKHLGFVMESRILGRYAPSYVPDENGKGGIFRKKNAVKDQIGQAMFYYLSYFRGTEDQRAKHDLNGNDIVADGFDFETFFSKQFLLAPSYSEPVFEKDSSGAVLFDKMGNQKIKYDSTGYPELYPQSLSFRYKVKLYSDTEHNFLSTEERADPWKSAFSFLYDDKTYAFNTNPQYSNNRFCLSAIFIQISDIAVKLEPESDLLLKNLLIEVHVNGKFYEEIPITQDFKYKVNRITGAVAEDLRNVYNQYYIYQFNKIHYFKYPVKGQVSFRLRGQNVNFGLTINHPNVSKEVKILIKVAHVLEMKPSVVDAYVVMRLATTKGQTEAPGEMEPVGHFEADTGKRVYENYMRYGTAYSLFNKFLGQGEVYASANPVYESLRKFISSNIKMAARNRLVDYEIDKEGNSVLYFSRFPFGMANTGVDIFRGMGPCVDKVGDRNMIGSSTEVFIPIIKGKKYKVWDSSLKQTEYICYMQKGKLTKFRHSSEFVGGDYYFISSASSPSIGVYEVDGITDQFLLSQSPRSLISIGEKEQFSPGTITNEWSMFMSYNLYHWSESSSWKTEMYGDIQAALNSRCLTSSAALENSAHTSKNVKLHLANVSWRQHDKPLIVTAPSAYNFIEGANTNMNYADSARPHYVEKFLNSCPIYPNPYVIKSVIRANGIHPRSHIIKVVLKGRLRRISLKPIVGKVSQNRDVWKQELQSPEFTHSSIERSDEFAVVSYLLMMTKAMPCEKQIIGDVSLDNQNFWRGHRPWGCCHPRFYFTKLIPYVSSNSLMYSDHYRQMEYYLRAMCNGFVNSGSELSQQEAKYLFETNQRIGSISVGGYDSAVGDYLFEHLMANSYDNSGGNKSAISPNMTSGGGG